MKARRIGTTTEFEVEGIIMNGIGYVMEEVEVLPTATEPSTEPDWNQIMIQASIAAMQSIIERYGLKPDLAQVSSNVADSLITELKKQII